MEPEVDLVTRWRAGESAAAEALFARHFDEVYTFLGHKVPDDADELAQQTFLKCLGAREQFRSQSSFRTYLFTIARNVLYDHLRSARRAEAIDLEVSSIADLATSQRTRLADAQERQHLRAVLRELPVELQTLLEYHYWHDFDAAALAEIFDTTPGAIRTKLSRARDALRERLAAEPPRTSDPMVSALNQPDDDRAR